MKAKLLVFLLIVFSQVVTAKPGIEFISPKNNSKFVKSLSGITVRFTSKPEIKYMSSNLIEIRGSKSGIHESSVKICDDGRTIIFTPSVKFLNNESVQVKIKPVKTYNDFSDEINFSFETEKENILISAQDILQKEINENYKSKQNTSIPVIHNRTSSLPADFPEITVTNSTNPSPGYIFLSNFSIAGDLVPYYLMILDNSGAPVYYKKLDTAAYDFKKQPNGNLTYFYAKTQKFYEMNPQYQIIDSFSCGNGYPTDLHELRLFQNGHAFLMSYDAQKVNMASIVPRGDSNAVVLGLIVQELDADKNVIFQWRSWDYYNIADCTHENLLLPVIDYVHGNAIELANDGNIIISARHLDEITKINRSTGDIIWRLGGKNNQFRFYDETITFSHQHAVRQLPNGNITMFDNGNYGGRLDPIHEHIPVSRAIEYQLDEANLSATLVWQYINNPAVYAYAMGYNERLPNGNSIISWGTGNPSVTEVSPDGEKVFEIALPYGIVSYRGLKDSWDPLPNNGIVPPSYNVYQNYPNPFNPSTTIKFDLPVQSDVKITVFNILGQIIQEELRPNLFPATYDFVFNGAKLTSGIYFYRINTNSFSDTKRMILVK